MHVPAAGACAAGPRQRLRSGHACGQLHRRLGFADIMAHAHHTRLVALPPRYLGRVGITCYVAGSMLAVPAAWMLPVEALRRKASQHWRGTHFATSRAPEELVGWHTPAVHALEVLPSTVHLPAP